MKSYQEMTKEELLQEKQALEAQYQAFCEKGLKLDMSRGKPSVEQLDLAMPMFDVLNSQTPLKSRMGTDLRNYGVLDGINEAKELMASLMDVPWENVIIYGNASLNIMYDFIVRSMLFGVLGSTPWIKLGRPVKFLCPVPGYDRHFAITESMGIRMINIPMDENGPDMDLVEMLVAEDPYIKGIWCVPKYSNPSGCTYSDEVVRRMARLKPAAKDFRIYWDNAYCVHHLYPGKEDHLLEILAECEAAGNPDMVYEFASTSKITLSGSGISAVASSIRNLDAIRKRLTIQTIGFDKINQLRHCKFLKDKAGVEEHMWKHAEIIRPKFDMLIEKFDTQLGDMGVGSWTKPNGGYFITYFANKGCAKRIVQLAKEAGMVMTGAGAPYPYGQDPDDSVIRIAPTLPPLEEMRVAADLFIICVKLASVEKLLQA